MTFKTLIMFLVFAAIVIFTLAIFAKAKARRTNEPDGSIEGTEAVPYFVKPVLTQPEQILFHRLKEALPTQIVLVQVAMNALVGIRKNPNWQRQFNEIAKKYVDYVVCLPDFTVVAIVELDDASHQRGERIKSDAIKDAAFKSIHYPVIRFHVSDLPSVETIRKMICL